MIPLGLINKGIGIFDRVADSLIRKKIEVRGS